MGGALTTDELEEIREAFKLFDTDDSGTIDSDGARPTAAPRLAIFFSDEIRARTVPAQSSRWPCVRWASSRSATRCDE